MSETSAQRPNILYIHSHDTGRWVSPYGYDFRTPHIARFAEQGTLFRQAFCANPTCSPSRACLLTGQSAHESGMLGLAHRGFSLNDYSQHLVHTLQPAGYQTYLCGLQHVAKNARTIGYDQLVPTASNKARDVTPAAVSFLRESTPQEPWFLTVGFYETHRAFPKHAPEDDPRYLKPDARYPDNPTLRGDMADFATMVNELDTAYDAVLEALEQSGQAENTLVIMTTDHGPAFPEMKCNLNDAGLGVLLMIRGPKSGSPAAAFNGGKVVDSMVSHLDIFPTLCDTLNIDRPDWLEGESLLPLVDGSLDPAQPDALHDMLFGEVNYHVSYEPMRSVRTPKYKYIRRFDPQPHRLLPNVDASPTLDWFVDRGWDKDPQAQEELYDLIDDPGETNNLAIEVDHAQALETMRRRLDQWMHDTHDPLLDGPIPEPKESLS